MYKISVAPTVAGDVMNLVAYGDEWRRFSNEHRHHREMRSLLNGLKRQLKTTNELQTLTFTKNDATMILKECGQRW